jgi:GNAT superfamily N-acetyltransferase
MLARMTLHARLLSTDGEQNVSANRTPGSVRGLSGEWQPYRDGVLNAPFFEATQRPMRTRPFSLPDASEIAALAGQLGYPVRAEDARTYLLEIEKDANHALFVAESDSGAIIGWIHVFRTKRAFAKPHAEVGGLVVDENHRGMGVGRALLEESEQWARREKCSTLLIRSNIVRGRARDFYQGAGYSLLKQQNVFKKEL